MLEKVKGLMIQPRCIWGLSNRVDIGGSDIVKGIGLAEPEIIERDEYLASLSFRSMVEARSVRFIKRCTTHLF